MKLKSKNSLISLKNWIACVKFHKELIWAFEHYKFGKKVYMIAILKVDDIVFGQLLYNDINHSILVQVEDSYLSEIIDVLNSINQFLGTHFYKENDTAYSNFEINKLIKRMPPF